MGRGHSKYKKLNTSIKIFTYGAGTLLISAGIVNFLYKILSGNAIGPKGYTAAVLLWILCIYVWWFKPPKKQKDYLKRAEVYIDTFNDRYKAIEILEKSLTLNNMDNSKLMETYIMLGSLYLKEKNDKRADEFFKKLKLYRMMS